MFQFLSLVILRGFSVHLCCSRASELSLIEAYALVTSAFRHSDVLLLSQECSYIIVCVIPGRLRDANPFLCYILAGLLTLC